ncbi:MAG TPA: sensor histidine kinase [Ktedonobacterales bacterium]
MARDLHDSVVQPLSSLIVGIEAWQTEWSSTGQTEAHVAAWLELAQEALNSLRDTLHGMRTHPHAELGLIEALRHYVAPQMRSGGVRMTVDSSNWPSDLPLDFTSTLYLAVREALTNVKKHARASEVAIVLRGTNERLAITIVDNGVGFAPEQIETLPTNALGAVRGARNGLRAIRERAQLIGGHVRIETMPGSGVRMRISAPRPASVL